MLSDQKKLWLEEYKELGLQFRYYAMEISTANRLMLPPLIIGLLVLYGAVEKFVGVELKNPEAAHRLIWFGSAIISLMWVFNVSRLAQMMHVILNILKKKEKKLIKEDMTIADMDKRMEKEIPYSKWLRHHILRLTGFGIYFTLLLLNITAMGFHGMLSNLKSIYWLIPWIAIIISLYLSRWIWCLYFKAPLSASQASPTELWDTKRRKFQDNKRQRFQMSMKWIFQYIFPAIIFLVLIAFSILMYVDLQTQPDANARLVRGLEYFAKGEYDNSIKDFNKVIALDPNNPGAYFNRGSIYYKKREFAYAIVDLDKAITLDSQNQSARALRDKAHKELENSDK